MAMAHQDDTHARVLSSVVHPQVWIANSQEGQFITYLDFPFLGPDRVVPMSDLSLCHPQSRPCNDYGAIFAACMNLVCT